MGIGEIARRAVIARRGAGLTETAAWGSVPGHHSVWPTPPQTELLRATLLADERALAAWRRIRPQIAVPELDGATNALLPHLRRNLLALGCDDELLPLFKGVHRYTWARNQLLLAETMPMIEALERAGIPTLLLKGSALLADGRLDAGSRPIRDVDVLVAGEQLAAACGVLAMRGMAPIEGAPLWYVTDYAPRCQPSFNFTSSSGGQLDLHWRALFCARQAGADDDFWTAARPVALRGVATRTLCPADELLVAIMHGWQWAPSPGYRWVLDAALLARGLAGEVDYDRLVAQARRRRVAPAVSAALRYLRQVADVELSSAMLRLLRTRAPIQRLELRAQLVHPGARGPLQRAAVAQLHELRGQVPAGTRVTPALHLRLAQHRLGLRGPSDLRCLRGGGWPGIGRPRSESHVPVGAGGCASPQAGWGAPLDFGDPETVRRHCVYGMWLPQGSGAWIAGREARLALELPEPPQGSLLLELSAAAFLERGRRRQRLDVVVRGERVARLAFGRGRRTVDPEGVVLPRKLVAGRSRLELVLRTPDAVAPASLRFNADDRRLGVMIRRLAIHRPRSATAGVPLVLGEGSGDERMLAGGWAQAEPGGRWTLGPRARILLAPTSPVAELAWSASPLRVAGALAPGVRARVDRNGVTAARAGCDEARGAGRVVTPHVAPGDELLVTWTIGEPRSPRQLGLSDDDRPLGLFFHDVTLS